MRGTREALADNLLALFPDESAHARERRAHSTLSCVGGCRTKAANTRALVTLECRDADFYRAGIVYRQLEPAWGRSADTATDLRCTCAMQATTRSWRRRSNSFGTWPCF